MAESIDELYARWQRNPDPAQTMALCEALRGSPRMDLVDIVGSHAARQLHVPGLVAAARMYTDKGRLDDAQAVLVAAGKLAPRDGDVYRWLGEVLLRRGDAERAEKVLERAVQFGSSEPSAAGDLLARARALLPTQRSSGAMAVADEVARSLASERHRLTPPIAPPSARIVPRSGKEDEEDIETQIRKHDDIRSALDAALAPLSKPPPAAGAPPPLRPPPASFQQQTANVGLPPPFSAAPVAPPPHSAPPPRSAPAPLPPPAPASSHAAGQGLAPLRAADFAKPGEAAYRGPTPTGGVPEPRDVLEALQIAGVYEPDGPVGPQLFDWDRPDRGKRRIASTVTLVAMAVLFVGGGVGIWHYVKRLRGKDHVIAEQVLAKVDADLRKSDANILDATEKDIGKSFELESRSPHAAVTWLHERALKGLLKGGEDLAFEESISRAKEVGVPEKNVAFAHVASFLFQGDTAGAAATVAKWDQQAQDDPWFHLLAGATFERAGDARAVERYSAAVKLDPDLFIAQVLLLRAMAVDGDPHRAAEDAKAFRAKFPDRVEPMALLALAWARDPMRGEEPAEVKAVTDKADALANPLRAVAYAAKGIVALEKRSLEEAKPALQKALSVAETPGVAAWIGSIALATGDEALARKAALAAVSFSALYAPARVLAARVALLGARLDEALKAVEDLPPSSADVAVVTAAVAYEKLDAERMARAFDAVDASSRSLPFVVPLARGHALLGGSVRDFGPSDKVLDMADDEGPWADLVAMDYALDTGDPELASKIAAQWTGDVRSPRAVRLARVARYQGKYDDADRLSKSAMEGGTVTIRALIERVFTLVALSKTADALALFKTYPNVGGPLAKWLRAYALAASGKIDEAKSAVSSEDPPPALAPLPARMLAACAYGAMKDTRHGNEYTKPLVQAGFANPDLAVAAEKLGLGKVQPRRR